MKTTAYERWLQEHWLISEVALHRVMDALGVLMASVQEREAPVSREAARNMLRNS